jgi:hypothetical protein
VRQWDGAVLPRWAGCLTWAAADLAMVRTWVVWAILVQLGNVYLQSIGVGA